MIGRIMHSTMPLDEAECGRDAIADVICWVAGYEAGGGESPPINIRALRDLKMNLADSIRRELDEEVLDHESN